MDWEAAAAAEVVAAAVGVAVDWAAERAEDIVSNSRYRAADCWSRAERRCMGCQCSWELHRS